MKGLKSVKSIFGVFLILGMVIKKCLQILTMTLYYAIKTILTTHVEVVSMLAKAK